MFPILFKKISISISQYANVEGYIIVINTSGEEQHIDLSAFSALGNQELHVLTAAPNSRFTAGYVQ
jgi:hypothetical protein